MEQEADKSNAKTNNFSKIVIAIGGFALGIVLAIVLLNLPSTNKDNTSNNGNKESGNNSSTYTYDTYKELYRRTNLIIYQSDTTSQSHTGIWPMHESLDSLNNISFEQKATIAHNATGQDFPSYSDSKWESLTDEDLKIISGIVSTEANAKEFYRAYRNFDITETEKQYKQIFGEDLDLTKDIVKLSYAFPGIDYLYSTKNKTLYSGGGGGQLPGRDFFYINNIEISDKTASVYFNVLNSHYDYTDEIDGGKTYTCYDDFEYVHAVTNCRDFLLHDGIDDTNYESLQNYRLIFEDDGTGNFVYKSAEKVK